MHRSLRRKKEARELKKSLLFSAERKPFRGGPSNSSGPKYGGGQYRSPLAGLYDSRYEGKYSQDQPSQEVTQSSQVFSSKYTRKVKFTSKKPNQKEGGGSGRESKHARGSNSARDQTLRFRGPCPRDRISKSRGKVSKIPNKLAKINSRSHDIKIHFRGRIGVRQNPSTETRDKKPTLQCPGKGKHRFGNRETVRKGSYRESEPRGRTVCRSFVLERKEEPGVPSRIQPQTVEQVHSAQALQDGNHGDLINMLKPNDFMVKIDL